MRRGCLLLVLLVAEPAAAQSVGGAADVGDADSGPAIPAPPPAGNSLLPRVSLDAGEGDLRSQLDTVFGTGVVPAVPASVPDYTITPGIGVSEEVIDHVTLGDVPRNGADAITEFTPSLTFAADTRRLQASLTYDPTAYIYADHSEYTQFAQAFAGSGSLVAIPDLFYVNAAGSVSQQATFGGVGVPQAVTLGQNDRQTVTSFSVSPYLSKTFGGTGTATLGMSYAYSATATDGDAPSVLLLPDGRVAAAAPPETWLGTTRAFGTFTTGEDFGRFRNEVSSDDQFFSGTLAPRGGQRLMETDSASYAINRFVAVTGMLGYENLDYGPGSFAYVGGVWAAGVILTTGRHSQVTIEYRHVDGFGSAYVQGSVQVTARLRVFGGYSEGVSSDLQDLQSTVLDSTAEDGALVGTALGLDAPLVSGSDFFGGYSPEIDRVRRLDLNAAWLGERDTLTLSVQSEKRSLVGIVQGVPFYSGLGASNGTVGTVSWRRELRHDLSAELDFSYGVTAPTALRTPDETDISVHGEIDKTFTETLTGYLRYAGTWRDSPFLGRSGEQNSLTVGLFKTF